MRKQPGTKPDHAGRAEMEVRKRVLIVDDDPDLRMILRDLLGEAGYETIDAEDGRQCLNLTKKRDPDALLLDLKMPGMSGSQVLKELRDLHCQAPVIIMTGYGDIRSAVEAMRLGAYDYLSKPFNNDELVLTIRRALEKRELLREVEDLRYRLKEGETLSMVMGMSSATQKVFQQIGQVADSDFSVILEGETGTGKELIAQVIHQRSKRKSGPFIAIDCGAIPETLMESELFGYEPGAFTGATRKKEGILELANGGTLFLDEITNLTLPLQAKLLRVLEERKVRRLGETPAADQRTSDRRHQQRHERSTAERNVPQRSLPPAQRVLNPGTRSEGTPGRHPLSFRTIPQRSPRGTLQSGAGILRGDCGLAASLRVARKCPGAEKRRSAGGARLQRGEGPAFSPFHFRRKDRGSFASATLGSSRSAGARVFPRGDQEKGPGPG